MLMDKPPVFSVIMTSYNYAGYVGEAIESVLHQTFEDWELLIVDDCSKDDSWSVIQQYKDPRIKSHRHAVNQGACAAYNHALAMAQGTYIASLDSDDLYLPTKLAHQAEFLLEHPEVDIHGTFVTEIESSGVKSTNATPYADWFNVPVDFNDPAKWLWQNRLCHSGAVVRADLHRRLGAFDNGLVYTPDWQFWIRALVAGARFAVSTQPLVGYRNHGSNITHKSRQSTLLEHAKTASLILVPWLQQQGRQDLMDQVLEGFVSDALIGSEIPLQTRIADVWFSGERALGTGAALMHLAIRQSMDLQALNKQSADWQQEKQQLQMREGGLPAENARLASQCDALLKRVSDNEEHIALLRFKLQDAVAKITRFDVMLDRAVRMAKKLIK